MPINWGDYLKDTRDLSTLQHGAYLLLIAHYWQHGGLPDDETRLAAVTGLTAAKWRSIRDPIVAKFQDGLRHKRIDYELEKAEKKMVQRAIAGSRGGTAAAISRAKATALARPIAAANSAPTGIAKIQQPSTININNRNTTTSSVAAREEEEEACQRKDLASPELVAILAKKGQK